MVKNVAACLLVIFFSGLFVDAVANTPREPKPFPILVSNGGMIGEFIDRYEDLRRSGQKVRIAGPCISSCTLALGIISPSRLCATRNARFGFHSATVGLHDPEFSPGGTRLVWGYYPQRLKDWLIGRGWDGDGVRAPAIHPSLIWLFGQQMARLVSICPG